MITVTRRIWRDKDGKPTTDPDKAVSMMHPEGSEVTEEQAKSLPKEAIADKSVKSAPENKAAGKPHK